MKKKSLFLAALAALTMATSCSQDEQQSVNKGHAIRFNAVLDVTRGADMTTGALEKFWVNAVDAEAKEEIFSNLAFIKTDRYWASEQKKCWPGKVEKINFYAYSPEVTAGDKIKVAGSKISNFTVKGAPADQIDLVTGYALGDRKAHEKTGIMSLPFTHALSKITFSVKGCHEVFKCKIYGIGIGNVKDQGDYDMAPTDKDQNILTGKWERQDGNASYFYDFSKKEVIITDNNADPESISPVGGFKLLPQALTPWTKKDGISKKLKETFIYMKIVITKSDEDNKVVFDGYAYIPIPNKAWEPNKEYAYTIDLSKGWGYRGGVESGGEEGDKEGGKGPIPDSPGTGDPNKPIIDLNDHLIKFAEVSISEWHSDENPQKVVEVSGETE